MIGQDATLRPQKTGAAVHRLAAQGGQVHGRGVKVPRPGLAQLAEQVQVVRQAEELIIALPEHPLRGRGDIRRRQLHLGQIGAHLAQGPVQLPVGHRCLGRGDQHGQPPPLRLGQLDPPGRAAQGDQTAALPGEGQQLRGYRLPRLQLRQPPPDRPVDGHDPVLPQQQRRRRECVQKALAQLLHVGHGDSSKPVIGSFLSGCLCRWAVFVQFTFTVIIPKFTTPGKNKSEKP